MEDQELFYSGCKKCYAVEYQAILTLDGLISHPVGSTLSILHSNNPFNPSYNFNPFDPSSTTTLSILHSFASGNNAHEHTV